MGRHFAAIKKSDLRGAPFESFQLFSRSWSRYLFPRTLPFFTSLGGILYLHYAYLRGALFTISTVAILCLVSFCIRKFSLWSWLQAPLSFAVCIAYYIVFVAYAAR